MRLGGWSRLGIVISALYGVLVTFIAYDARPRLERLEDAWFAEAAAVIADAISKDEGTEFSQYDIRDALLKKGRSENTAWLERVATTPSEKQKLFSLAIKQVNEKYKALIAELPDRQVEYWLLALALWAGGTLLLFGAGWTVRWIYRGFRRNAA
jgi:hypothetical protein